MAQHEQIGAFSLAHWLLGEVPETNFLAILESAVSVASAAIFDPHCKERAPPSLSSYRCSFV
jgi:hypothetical protein